jgi:hypothetical protein
MKHLDLVALLLSTTLLLGISHAASAQDEGCTTYLDAIAEVDIVIAAINVEGNYINGRNLRAEANRSNLENKALAAILKLEDYKFSDAADKLDAISDKVLDWQDPPKEKIYDAWGIVTAVNDALACIIEVTS